MFRDLIVVHVHTIPGEVQVLGPTPVPTQECTGWCFQHLAQSSQNPGPCPEQMSWGMPWSLKSKGSLSAELREASAGEHNTALGIALWRWVEVRIIRDPGTMSWGLKAEGLEGRVRWGRTAGWVEGWFPQQKGQTEVMASASHSGSIGEGGTKPNGPGGASEVREILISPD